MTTPFKTCPMCGMVWPTRDALLADPTVILCGYQVDFEELVAGLFLFNHRPCGTTFSLPVGAFEDLRDGPVFTERLAGTSDCPEHCLRTADLEPCPRRCECSWVRDVIQRIRTWPPDPFLRPGAGQGFLVP